MDVVLLSRVQFAVATLFHFIFVPLTLGLSVLVAILETLHLRTRDEDYLKATKFFGKLFLINFAIGVVTGITLEFQFGTNWSRYSEYVGDVFGPLLAIEATVAFFLESTFLGVWIFGWKKLPPKLHALAIWLVALASNTSAYWILSANAWMQHPVGYEIRNGRAELTDFLGVAFQPFAILEFLHTVSGAWLVGGFFVLGISAWHLARGNQERIFRKTFRLAAIWTAFFSLFVAVEGHFHAEHVGRIQPAKLAAMESLWETQDHAPMHLLLWPDEQNERNHFEALSVPGALSILAGFSPDHVVKGLKEFPREDRPPVALTFTAFRLMVGIGILMILIALAALWRSKEPGKCRLLRWLPWAIPLPYLAIEFGWMVAEVGRQPWIVYGMMRTSDAASPIHSSQVLFTVVVFVLLYGLLGAVDIYLLVTNARKGIDGAKA